MEVGTSGTSRQRLLHVRALAGLGLAAGGLGLEFARRNGKLDETRKAIGKLISGAGRATSRTVASEVPQPPPAPTAVLEQGGSAIEIEIVVDTVAGLKTLAERVKQVLKDNNFKTGRNQPAISMKHESSREETGPWNKWTQHKHSSTATGDLGLLQAWAENDNLPATFTFRFQARATAMPQLGPA